MKLCQVIEYKKKNFFLQESCRKRDRERLVKDLFLVYKKTLYKVKASGAQISFNVFLIPSKYNSMQI